MPTVKGARKSTPGKKRPVGPRSGGPSDKVTTGTQKRASVGARPEKSTRGGTGMTKKSQEFREKGQWIFVPATGTTTGISPGKEHTGPGSPGYKKRTGRSVIGRESTPTHAAGYHPTTKKVKRKGRTTRASPKPVR